MKWPATLMILGAVAGCGADHEPAAAPQRDFTFQLPKGWHLFTESQTPSLGNPVEILAAGTVPAGNPAEGSCAHVPVSALEAMGPDDAFVTVQERYGEPRFPPRPERIVLPKPSYTDARACARNGTKLVTHWWGFADAGRGFHVLVVFGRTTPEHRRAEAVALLDSLRFAPGPENVHIDPDLAVPFEDAGLRWQMPVPPWRRYDAPPDRILLGTFDLHKLPEDPCGPPPIPPRDAFIAVCEIDRARETHVYLGDGASAALERDARSIVNSIQTFTDRIPSGS